MARKLRVEYEGAIYHVTIRGVERRRLFDDDRDRQRFLRQVAGGVELDGVRLYLFCLMTNHVHLLIETPRANLAQFMHRLQTAYTVFYNLRHRRAGHLMQGRYGALPVEGDEYLLKLSRYVHLNPVCVGAACKMELRGRIRLLRDYPWSSYRSYIGMDKQLEFVDYKPVLAMMGGRERSWGREYRKFVESGLAETDEEFAAVMKKPGWGIGGAEFRERIRDLHGGLALKESRPEDVAFRREGRRVAVALVRRTVLEIWGAEERDLGRRGGGDWLRAVTAKMLCRYSGCTQRDVAPELGIETGAAVSIQLKKLGEALAADRALCERVKVIDERLNKHLEHDTAPI